MYYLISYLDGYYNHQMDITTYHPVEWLVRVDNSGESPLARRVVILNVLEFSSAQYGEILARLNKDGLATTLIELDRDK